MSIADKYVKIEMTDDSIEKWANRSYITDTTREKVLAANVLFIPNEGDGNGDMITFPAGTAELFHFLNTSKREELRIEACIEDYDYRELSLHTDLLTIVEIVVDWVVVPIVVNLISDYIKERLNRREENTTVRSTIIVVDQAGKHARKYSYDGPLSQYPERILNAIFQEDASSDNDEASSRNESNENST